MELKANDNTKRKPKVYISGALTNVDKLEVIKRFYENIAEVCKSKGFDPYLPHVYTDPANNSITPQQVFEIDKRKVQESNLLIACLDFTSFGVGMELAYAQIFNVDIVLLHKDSKTISKMVLGIPNIISRVVYMTHKNALGQLHERLDASKYVIRNSVPI